MTDQRDAQSARLSANQTLADLPTDLPPAAQRALAEAEARRQAAAVPPASPVELGGRDGLEPVRYGDWEKKGLAVDF